jgi:hypothetical protein
MQKLKTAKRRNRRTGEWGTISKIGKITGAVVLIAVIIGFIVWLSPTIMPILQNSSSNSPDGASPSYTSLMLRTGNYTEPIKLGDAEYSFNYNTLFYREINVVAPITSDKIENPKVGDTYKGLGIEVKVTDVSSDYLSDYVVIKIRSTTDNYMFSTYRYTKVELPSENMKPITISSGIIDKTNDYEFQYFSGPVSISRDLKVSSGSLTKHYNAYLNQLIPEAKSDFNIEIFVFRMDSSHMVIYVKPMY